MFLTVAEVALEVRVSESLVYEWARLGKIPVYRPGCRGRGKILISRDDLKELMASFRIEAHELADDLTLKHLS